MNSISQSFYNSFKGWLKGLGENSSISLENHTTNAGKSVINLVGCLVVWLCFDPLVLRI